MPKRSGESPLHTLSPADWRKCSCGLTFVQVVDAVAHARPSTPKHVEVPVERSSTENRHSTLKTTILAQPLEGVERPTTPIRKTPAEREIYKAAHRRPKTPEGKPEHEFTATDWLWRLSQLECVHVEALRKTLKGSPVLRPLEMRSRQISGGARGLCGTKEILRWLASPADSTGVSRYRLLINRQKTLKDLLP